MISWAEAHKYDERLLALLPDLAQQVEDAPDDPEPYEKLIYVLWDLGHYADALQWAQSQQAEQPASPLGYFHAAASLYLMKRSQEALPFAKAAIQRAKKVQGYRLMLQLLKRDLGKGRGEANERERLLCLQWLRMEREGAPRRFYHNPNGTSEADRLLKEAYILMEMGRFDDAREKLVDALLHDPTHAQARADLIIVMQLKAPLFTAYLRLQRYLNWILRAVVLALVLCFLVYNRAPVSLLLVFPLIDEVYATWLHGEPLGYVSRAAEIRRNERAWKLFWLLVVLGIALPFLLMIST